jgi:hypothetical protein
MEQLMIFFLCVENSRKIPSAWMFPGSFKKKKKIETLDLQVKGADGCWGSFFTHPALTPKKIQASPTQKTTHNRVERRPNTEQER